MHTLVDGRHSALALYNVPAVEAPGRTAARMAIEPARARIDEQVSIRVLGLEPNQTVVLRARMRDDLGGMWRSHAAFRADATGAVNVSSQPALSGTYQGIDQMGLFWSMAAQDELKAASFILQTPLTPTIVTLTAEVDGEVVASATVERTHIAPSDVRVIRVRENGLVGTLFRPDDERPRPAIIVLGGSEGGLWESPAALLASQGYVALALGYYGKIGRAHV